MTASTVPAQLSDRLAEFGQQHVLRFWKQLAAEERAQLASQVESLDLKRLARLWQGHASSQEQDWASLARKAQPPDAVRAADLSDPERRQAVRRGRDALAAGELGVLLVAGGQGTRLGFEHPKGMYPLGPVSAATLFQILLEKIIATARRYQSSLPLYVMTSHATHEETVRFLQSHDRFGLADEDLFLFQQGTMPAVDAQTGKLLLAEPGRLFLSPDGHGGTLAALSASGALDDVQRRGIRQLFYMQVDNPLAPLCDAELIGHHLMSGSELTSLAVPKETPQDKLGNFVSIDGRAQVIEYSDFPEDVASQREAEGSLRFWAGSVAIHVFDVAFLQRMLDEPDALPFHLAHKKVPYVDESGQRVEPESPNALKFERFIFDLLPRAENAIVVEAERERVFAPLKNAPGAQNDTAEHVQQQMIRLHRRWLEGAGLRLPPNIPVEISPLWALDEDDLAKRPLPEAIQQATYLHL